MLYVKYSIFLVLVSWFLPLSFVCYSSKSLRISSMNFSTYSLQVPGFETGFPHSIQTFPLFAKISRSVCSRNVRSFHSLIMIFLPLFVLTALFFLAPIVFEAYE